MFSKAIQDKAKQLHNLCQKYKIKVSIAESCTGGLLTALLTSLEGASSILDRGFVTYSNDSKIELLSVAPELLEQHGAVHEEIAAAMAFGAIKHSKAILSVAITGIAGPGGGSEHKPVGLVFIAVAIRGGTMQAEKWLFAGERHDIRNAAIGAALDMLIKAFDD
jgi:nicotinamide-nucleotide amidase